MSHNLRLFLHLSPHTDHAPTLLPDTVVSYDKIPLTQPPSLHDQLAAVQVQLETLIIDTVQGQDVEPACS